MTPEEKSTIEAVVNSQEAVDIAQASRDDPHSRWEDLRILFEKKLGRSFTEDDWDSLERDLYDWWKNGNFRVWSEDEKNSFGMTKWELGEPDFWEEEQVR